MPKRKYGGYRKKRYFPSRRRKLSYGGSKRYGKLGQSRSRFRSRARKFGRKYRRIRRRGGKSFSRRVKDVLDKSLRYRTYVKRVAHTAIEAASGAQAYGTNINYSPSLFREVATALGNELVTVGNDTKLNFKCVTHIHEFRNVTNIPVNITFYWMRARIDLTDMAGSPTVLYYSPGLAWSNGLQTTGAGNTALDELQIGVVPQDSPFTGRYWPIYKQKHMILPVGGIKRIYMKKKDFSISGSKYLDTDSYAIKGLTTALLYVIHGTTALNGTTEYGTPGKCKVAGTSIIRLCLRNDTDLLSDKTFSFSLGDFVGATNTVVDYALAGNTTVDFAT